MANMYYTKRAVDKLDLVVVIDFYLSKINSKCKGAVAFAATLKVKRFQEEQKYLEQQLSCLCEGKQGVIERIAKMRKVKAIKKHLAEVNNKLIAWINAVYKYFIA